MSRFLTPSNLLAGILLVALTYLIFDLGSQAQNRRLLQEILDEIRKDQTATITDPAHLAALNRALANSNTRASVNAPSTVPPAQPANDVGFEPELETGNASSTPSAITPIPAPAEPVRVTPPSTPSTLSTPSTPSTSAAAITTPEAVRVDPIIPDSDPSDSGTAAIEPQPITPILPDPPAAPADDPAWTMYKPDVIDVVKALLGGDYAGIVGRFDKHMKASGLTAEKIAASLEDSRKQHGGFKSLISYENLSEGLPDDLRVFRVRVATEQGGQMSIMVTLNNLREIGGIRVEPH